jgi:malonyl-CoA/methylmalonyl-CoA synthetase
VDAADRLLLVLPLHPCPRHHQRLGSRSPCARRARCFRSFDAEKVWERLRSGEITVFTAVPTIYHRLIRLMGSGAAGVQRARDRTASRRLRLMMSGSAALPVQTLERWREITGTRSSSATA